MSAKLGEYFELSEQIKTLRADLKDLVDEHELTDEVSELKKEVKHRTDQIAEDEGIKGIKEKMKQLKERQDLLKEIIIVEMKQANQEKVEYEGNEIVLTNGIKVKRSNN